MLYFTFLRFISKGNAQKMNRSSLFSPRFQHKVVLLVVLAIFAVGF